MNLCTDIKLITVSRDSADIYVVGDLVASSTGKPAITYDDKYKSAQKLKAGSTLTISVNVAGSPTPKVSWLQADEAVAGASIETKDNRSSLTVKNATPKLAGSILVKAENKVGSDSAEFAVEIKGLKNARFVFTRCIRTCIWTVTSNNCFTLFESFRFQRKYRKFIIRKIDFVRGR